MRTDPFIHAFLKTVRRHDMWQPGDTVLVALSGGKDSVALVHALKSIERLADIHVVAGHVDHRLRAESADDARWVADICERAGIELGIVTLDATSLTASPLGIEAAARQARHAALEKLADDFTAVRIATAHHRDDQAETVLERLTRGAGTKGLRGILPVKGRWIRPFLDVSRAQIDDYVHARRLAWREDETNAETDFARNALRHVVLPALRAMRPGCDEVLARVAESARREETVLDAAFRADLTSWGRLVNGMWILDATKMRKATRERRQVFWHRFLWELESDRVDLDLADTLDHMLFSRSRSPRLSVGSNLVARREGQVLTFSPASFESRDGEPDTGSKTPIT